MEGELKPITCKNPGCIKPARIGRKQCRPCEYVRLRDKDPIKFCFLALRRNARRRGIEFTITLEDFIEFCIETPYMIGKGRSLLNYHVDRHDETKGYVRGNLRCVTHLENRQKYLDYRWNGRKMEFTTKTIDTSALNAQGDCPF